MICPKCGRRMDWYINGLIRPGAGRRTCPSCGAELEILNANVGLIINSILLAVGLLGIWIGELPFMWLWIALLGMCCWLLLPVWTRLFARLVVWSYSIEQQAKFKRLAAESTASTILMGAWVFYMAFTLVVPYGQIISGLGSLDDNSWDKMEEFTNVVSERFASLRGMIELTIGAFSFCWCQVNIARRVLLKRKAVASRLQQQDIIRSKGT